MSQAAQSGTRLPVVVIAGRANVGKSTLFNRLTGKRHALVDDTPGVTRDRREGEGRLGGLKFTIVDTAGLAEADRDSLAARMTGQSRAAMQDADICLFMIDARTGLTPEDRHFAAIVRRTGKPVVVLANKCESGRGEAGCLEAFGLGLGEPLAVSAEHGHGLDELHDRLAQLFETLGLALHTPGETPRQDTGETAGDLPDRPLRLAIVGRPNAGKSTLVNRLLGEERMLTGPEAGITRDAIAIDWQWNGQPVRLWDTAGMRKKARVQDKLEKLSVADGLRAVRFAEVVVLLIDATELIHKQDLQLASLVEREGRALVIAVNKWDLVEDKAGLRRELEREFAHSLPQLAGVAIVPLSGLTGRGTDRLMPAVMATYRLWNTRVPTHRLNTWLEAQVERHPPPASSGRRIRLRYMTQANARPPTFVVFCSKAAGLPESYRRYLINGLREDFGLWGVPVRLGFRQGSNPYAGRRGS